MLNQEVTDENIFKTKIENARKMCADFYDVEYIAEKLNMSVKTVKCIKKECDLYKWYRRKETVISEKIKRYNKLRGFLLYLNKCNKPVNSDVLSEICQLSKELIPEYEEVVSYLKWYINSTDNLSEIEELEKITRIKDNLIREWLIVPKVITDYYNCSVSRLNTIKKFYENLIE